MNETMRRLGAERSAIRELFEYGKKRKAEIGADRVFDFSLGNPSVPTPQIVTDALCDLLRDREPTALHGYTSAQGDLDARRAIAEHLNVTYSANADPALLYLTAGAAASLTISLNAILNPGDEVILLAPYFPEYRVFAERAGGRVVSIEPDPDTFLPNFDALEQALSSRTRALILNSPNNPSGAILPPDGLRRLCNILERQQQENGQPIWLISDEPYRELVWDGSELPFVTRYYRNSLVLYSFSKSLSLPGERIGYILVSSLADGATTLYQAICGAGRALGFVCAPALFQHLLPACLGATADFSIYRKNRDLLYHGLTALGFDAVEPQGAFYLFLRSPEPDAVRFAERAKALELLVVPSDSFGIGGYVRISYCVPTERITSAMPAFAELAKQYGLTPKEQLDNTKSKGTLPT